MIRDQGVFDFTVNCLHYLPDDAYKEVIPRIRILNSDLFFEILFTLGIKKTPFELKQQLIDRVLVKNRNEVAHGKDTPVTKAEFDLLFKEVTDMLELFRKEIIIAAKSKSFSIPSKK